MKTILAKGNRRLAVSLCTLAVLLAMSFAIPALANTREFSYDLPAWQGNVTVVTGNKSKAASTKAVVKVYSSAKYGGKFWVDRGYNNRVTDTKDVKKGTSASLAYYKSSKWTDKVQLRACQSGWGPNAKDHTAGTVNFG